MTFSKNGIIKREWVSEDGSAAKKWKMVTLEEVKFRPNLNGVVEEIANCRDVDTVAVRL